MSSDKVHVHVWHTTTKPDILACQCDTVAKLSDLLHNVATQAGINQRVKLISEMLFANELKKDARDKYYAWVMKQNNVEAKKMLDNQGSLL